MVTGFLHLYWVISVRTALLLKKLYYATVTAIMVSVFVTFRRLFFSLRSLGHFNEIFPLKLGDTFWVDFKHNNVCL